MIKKIFGILLLFWFTVLNFETVFAKDFFSYLDDNIPHDLGISKEKVKLKSFLNKEYRVYKYTLKNKGNKEYFLYLNTYHYSNEWLFRTARSEYRRDKFPYSYGHVLRATGETIGLGVAYTSVILCPPLGFIYAMADDADTGVMDFDNVPRGWDIPKTYLLNPVKSVLFLPRDLLMNSKEIQKAKDESKEIEALLVKERKLVSVKPGEEIEFYTISTLDSVCKEGFEIYTKTKEGHLESAYNFLY